MAAALVAGGVGVFYAWEHREPLQVRLCEEFIKDALASPSSYRRVEVLEGDEPITVEELQKLRGKDFFDEIYADKARSLHIVSIEYDADNSYGANSRSAGTCAFEKIEGEFASRDIMKSKARMATRTARLRGLVEAGLVPDVKPSDMGKAETYDCCL